MKFCLGGLGVCLVAVLMSSGCATTTTPQPLSENYIPVKSSSLQAARYDGAQRVMWIKFTSGVEVGFEEVPPSVFERFMRTGGKLGFYRANIKHHYARVGLDPNLDPDNPEILQVVKTDLEKVKSKMFDAAGYYREGQVLSLRFYNGNVHEYEDVPEQVYEDFMRTPAKKGFYMANIKDQYAFNVIKPEKQAQRIVGYSMGLTRQSRRLEPTQVP